MRNLCVLSALLVALLMAGCGKKSPPAETVQEELEVVPLVICDDASAKNALVNEVRAKIDVALADLLADDDNKTAINRLAQSRLSMLAVDLEDVQSVAGGCQARVLLSVSDDELLSANSYFSKQGISVEGLLNDANASIKEGYLGGQISYSQDDNTQIHDLALFELFAKIIKADAQNNIKTKKTSDKLAQPVTPSVTEIVPRPATPTPEETNLPTDKPAGEPKANTPIKIPTASDDKTQDKSADKAQDVKGGVDKEVTRTIRINQGDTLETDEPKKPAQTMPVIETNDTY